MSRTNPMASFAIMCGLIMMAFSLTSSKALAELLEDEISIGINCDDDAAATCANRKSPNGIDPATCATSNSGTEPCTPTATAAPGTTCSCRRQGDDQHKCYCHAANP